jgi:hypothetical protein
LWLHLKLCIHPLASGRNDRKIGEGSSIVAFTKKDYLEASRLTLKFTSSVGLVVGLPVAIFKATNIPPVLHWLVSLTGLTSVLVFFGASISWRAIHRALHDPPIEGFDHLKAENLKNLAESALKRLKARQSSPVSMGAGLAVKYVLLEITHKRLEHFSKKSMQRVNEEMTREAVKDGKLIGNREGFKRVGGGISQLANDMQELITEKLRWLKHVDPLLQETRLLDSVASFCDRLNEISIKLTEWGTLGESAFTKKTPDIITEFPTLQTNVIELQNEMLAMSQSLYREMLACQELVLNLQDA